MSDPITGAEAALEGEGPPRRHGEPPAGSRLEDRQYSAATVCWHGSAIMVAGSWGCRVRVCCVRRGP